MHIDWSWSNFDPSAGGTLADVIDLILDVDSSQRPSSDSASVWMPCLSRDVEGDDVIDHVIMLNIAGANLDPLEIDLKDAMIDMNSKGNKNSKKGKKEKNEAEEWLEAESTFQPAPVALKSDLDSAERRMAELTWEIS